MDVSHLPAMMADVRDLESCLRALLDGCDALNLNQIEDAMLANFPGTRIPGKEVLVIGTTQELCIATAAQAHVGAAAMRLDYASAPVGPWLYTADVTREPVRFENGTLLIPEGIGLGIEADAKKIEAIFDSLSSLKDVLTNFTRG